MKRIEHKAPEGFMTGQEVCGFLGISLRCVKNYQKRRILPHYKFGHFVYFKREEIIAAIEATKVEAKAKP